MYNQDQSNEEVNDEDDDENEEVGEMKAKFDKIMATFIDDQRGNNQRYQAAPTAITPSGAPINKDNLYMSEKREGITDFKNKNLQNNMRGLLKQQQEQYA